MVVVHIIQKYPKIVFKGFISLVVVSSDHKRLKKALCDQEMLHNEAPQIIYNKKIQLIISPKEANVVSYIPIMRNWKILEVL